MKVIGIDVGPSKGGHVCEDGHLLKRKTPEELDKYLQSQAGDVLIAWDAPLTGPPDPDVWKTSHDLTQRKIEKFFAKKGPFKAPKGIAVLPYSSCQHWTISRRLLGLPRVGRFDLNDGLPYRLVQNDNEKPSAGRYVVEVHPAVAMWLWCKDDHSGDWNYKKDPECRRKLSGILSAKNEQQDISATDDDELDSWIAWYLAKRWLERDGVKLVGNAEAGSFLLPNVPNLESEFHDFVTVK